MVALLFVMLLVGTLVSSLLIGVALKHYSNLKLVQVVQGAAALTMALNVLALWKQEPRDPARAYAAAPTAPFAASWRAFVGQGRTRRLLVAVGLGAAGFSMQDVLVEPYGGQVLGLSVGETTWLTAVWAAGTLAGFALAASRLKRGGDPLRLAGAGVTVGLGAFAAIILAAPVASAALLTTGVALVGVGGGLFAVGTLLAAMALAQGDGAGMALGAWGAVQASALGAAILSGGVARDLIGRLAARGALGAGLESPTTGYALVYGFEIALLFGTLVALGPLVRRDWVELTPGADLAPLKG